MVCGYLLTVEIDKYIQPRWPSKTPRPRHWLAHTARATRALERRGPCRGAPQIPTREGEMHGFRGGF